MAFNGTYNVSTSYDALGRVRTVTDAGGYTRASQYNSFGFLSSVHEGTITGNVLWQGMSYDASGKMLLEWHGNGIGTANRYHPTRGFLESTRTMRYTTNAHIQESEMKLDDLGNVLWRREQRFESPTATTPPVRIETFGYDRLNRLTHSRVTGQDLQSYTFTANGNIATKSGIGSYSYGERSHGPHAVTSITQGTQVQRSYTYDAKGRMTQEHLGTDLSVYLRDIKYTSFDQPKTITHLGAAALSSDQGQLDDGSSVWDQICTLSFYFGPGLQRLIQTKHKGQLVTKTLSLGGFEIREVTSGASLTGPVIEREERSHFGNGVRVIRYLGPKELSTTPTSTSYEFAAKDHLGSDTATFDGQGQMRQQRGHLKPGEVQKTERQSYDPWGARRDGETWAPAPGQLNKLSATEATMTAPSQTGGPPSGSPPERAGSNLPRGYTGHEMLDDVGLIHMNGRLYDSALGRMCAADRDVQAPDMIQNYNRYSYVLNNPMNATDPSGHNWFKKIIGIIVAVIIAIIIVIVAVYALGALLGSTGGLFGATASGVLPGTGAVGFLTGTSVGATSFLGVNTAIVLGAAVGATWAAVNTAIQGGSSSQVLKSAIIGAANGAVGAIVGGGLHTFGDWAGSALAGGNDIWGTAAHMASHGVFGGAMSEANGGSFQDGFIGGLVGAGSSGLGMRLYGGTDLYSSKEVWAVAGRTAISAVTGGLSSMATGGKFADGAYSAAFFHLFNAEKGFWDGVRDGFSIKNFVTGVVVGAALAVASPAILAVAGAVAIGGTAYAAYDIATSENPAYAAGEFVGGAAAGGVGGGIGAAGTKAAIKGLAAKTTATPAGNIYSTAFEMKLAPTSYPGLSRGSHFQEANGALLRAMEGDAAVASSMQQLGVNLSRTPTGLAPRTSPAGWTWHHAPEPGVMQLVPRPQHAPGSIFQPTLHPGGVGGFSIWGK